MPINVAPSERSLRRRFAKQGIQVRKVRESSRWYVQYGPYMLVDEQNHLLASGLTYPDLVREFVH